MLEKYFIDCCSPTLASLKLGSLFNYKVSDDESVEDGVHQWNERFAGMGLGVYLLRRTSHSALIYVYRKSALEAALSNEEIRYFLGCYNYECKQCVSERGTSLSDRNTRFTECTVDCCLEHLRDRINRCSKGNTVEFPHEIGVFLGYPLYDVKCFITNHGKNSKYTGTWKVYGDAEQATRTFAKFDKCRRVYQTLWQSGQRSVLQLTVAG